MEDPIPGLKGRFFIKQSDPNDNFVEPMYKVQKDFQYPCFNPATPWNECKPILGMKYESPSQLKQCLANFGVTFGSHLWYMQNDTYKLLVKCGRDVSACKCAGKRARGSSGSSDKGKGKLGEEISKPSKVSQATKERWRKKKLQEKENLKNVIDCPFRLWASWMSTKKSFQIKSLYPDHKCCRNYNLRSLVTFRWIAEHYAREIIDNPWVSYNYMQNFIRSKFMINKSDLPKPLPPGERKLPGRPRKRRIRHPLEYDHEISRVGRVMHCYRCSKSGHNKSKCTNVLKPKPDNFYEISAHEDRQNGSNTSIERGQYQQVGPSDDEIPKYREDLVMPPSSSGNKRKKPLIKKKSSQVNKASGSKSNLTQEEHAEMMNKEAFVDMVRTDAENKAKDEEM
nr:hypothetical protein [Tanacetum cinerariifolium]